MPQHITDLRKKTETHIELLNRCWRILFIYIWLSKAYVITGHINSLVQVASVHADELRPSHKMTVMPRRTIMSKIRFTVNTSPFLVINNRIIVSQLLLTPSPSLQEMKMDGNITEWEINQIPLIVSWPTQRNFFITDSSHTARGRLKFLT